MQSQLEVNYLSAAHTRANLIFLPFFSGSLDVLENFPSSFFPPGVNSEKGCRSERILPEYDRDSSPFIFNFRQEIKEDIWP